MSAERKPFAETQIYPILFMLAVTIIFVGVLSVFYRSTEKSIDARKEQTHKLNILSMFADTLSILTGTERAAFVDPASADANFTKYIRVMEFPVSTGTTISSQYYRAQTVEDNILGFCFEVTGSGLWGTMRGLLAVTPDYQRIINFMIYDQMETPGLGSRVEENWFRQQFSGKPLFTDNTPANFALVPEEADANALQVRQITGASITSTSVLKIIKAAAEQLLSSATDLAK
jgi:Na+-transporting NADH:ubiquinone oxidoreductase subunit C